MKRKVHPFRCLRWKQSFLIRWLRMFFLPPKPPSFKVEGRTRRTCRNDCFFRRTKPMMKKQHLTTLMSGGAGGMFLSLRAWLFLSQTPVEACRFICSFGERGSNIVSLYIHIHLHMHIGICVFIAVSFGICWWGATHILMGAGHVCNCPAKILRMLHSTQSTYSLRTVYGTFYGKNS